MENASSNQKIPVLLDKINKIECKLLQDSKMTPYVTPADIQKYNLKTSDNIKNDSKNLNNYAKFNDTHTTVNNSICTITDKTEIEELISAGTCQINSPKGLKRLEMLSMDREFSSTPVNIILSSDIDMSECKMWGGIRNFRGTFDGNGYIISNLSGIQGLFAGTKSATVKNVGLKDLNIKGRLSYTGGLIGYAKTTNISNCFVSGTVTSDTTSSIKDITSSDDIIYSCSTGGLIGLSYVESGNKIKYENVFSTVDVTGNDGVGGLAGSQIAEHSDTVFCVKNAYSTGNVTGRNGVGGFAGIIYGGENNPNYFTSASNCYAGGNVSGVSDVGGFFGMYLCFNDKIYTGYKIENCKSAGKVTGSSTNVGAFAGHIYIKTKNSKTSSLFDNFITFKNCGYCGDKNDSQMFGNTTNESIKSY